MTAPPVISEPPVVTIGFVRVAFAEGRYAGWHNGRWFGDPDLVGQAQQAASGRYRVEVQGIGVTAGADDALAAAAALVWVDPAGSAITYLPPQVAGWLIRQPS